MDWIYNKVADYKIFFTLGCVVNVACTGFAHSYINIAQILEREGNFQDECDDGENGCSAQRTRIAFLISSAMPAVHIGEFLGSTFSDIFGPRILAIISMLMIMTGCYLFGTSDISDFNQLLAGHAMMLAGTRMVFFATVALVKRFRFPRKISSLFVSFFALSQLVMVSFNLIHSNSDVSKETLFTNYEYVLAFGLLTVLLLFPTTDRLRESIKKWEEKQQSDMPARVAPALPQSSESDLESVIDSEQAEIRSSEGSTASEESDVRTVQFKVKSANKKSSDLEANSNEDDDEEVSVVMLPHEKEAAGLSTAVAGTTVVQSSTSSPKVNKKMAALSTTTVADSPKKQSPMEKAESYFCKAAKNPAFLTSYLIFGCISVARNNAWKSSINSYMYSYGDDGSFAFALGMMLPFNFVFSQLTSGITQHKGLPRAMLVNFCLHVAAGLCSAVPIYQFQIVTTLIFMAVWPFTYSLLYTIGMTLSPKKYGLTVGVGQLIVAAGIFALSIGYKALLSGPLDENYSVYFLILVAIQPITLIAPLVLKKKGIFQGLNKMTALPE